MYNVKKIEKFNGNNKILCVLYRTEKNELYAAYCLIDKIEYRNFEDTQDYFNGHLISTRECKNEIVIELLERYSHFMTLVKVRDKEEYEHICSVVENLL